jgi:hypothetical protein
MDEQNQSSLNPTPPEESKTGQVAEEKGVAKPENNQVPEKAAEPVKAEPPKPEEKKEEAKNPGVKNVAWDKIFNDFCTVDKDGCYPSLRDLAAKYKLNESALFRQSANGNWPGKRSELIAKIQQKAIEFKAKEIDEANNRHLRRWRWVQTIAMFKVKDYETEMQTYRKEISEAKTQKAKNKLKEPSIYKFEKIVSVLKTAIEGERVVLGLPTIVNKTELTNPVPVSLPPELIKEIDSLFEKNGGTTENPTNN